MDYGRTGNSPGIDKILRFVSAAKDQQANLRETFDQDVADTGRTALGLLQQTVQVMKAREARTQAMAQRAADDLAAASARIRSLEARALQAEARAKEAERWLTRLREQIQDTLADWQVDEPRNSPRSVPAM